MSLKSKLTSELPQLIGFAMVGGAGFLVHFFVMFILLDFGNINNIIAWFPAFILGVTFTWLLNRFLTFRGMGRLKASGEALRYLLIQSFGAAVNFIIYASLVTSQISVLSYPLTALACGAVVALFFNFTALRIFVFQKVAHTASVSGDTVDDIYYEHAMSVPLARKLTVYARQRMFSHFMKVMTPTNATTILDFGASEAENEEANILEKSYPYREKITCAGLGDGAEILAAYPEISYVSVMAGAPLPFADNSFDIAYSNAVFEHVGSKEVRHFLLNELNRVAVRVYIATPNRWFPIEHHTAIPLIHFWPKGFRKFTSNGKYSYWSLPQNLQFLSLGDLRHVFSLAGMNVKSGYTGLYASVFSSNIACWTPPK